MGSSYFAGAVAARRLRAAGIVALAERASVATPLRRPGWVSVVISNGGRSPEALTLAASLGEYVAVTNQPDSPLATGATTVVELGAGVELSGVSAKSYAATLVRLLQLEATLGVDPDGRASLRRSVERAADAIDELLATKPAWVDQLAADLVGPQGTWLLAPAERSGSALQGALMLRESPRRQADGCETGDWSHVDVYLTKPLDYRALLFAGSAWDTAAVDWMRQRGATWWSVGATRAGDDTSAGAAATLRYDGDDDAVVALLAEVTVAELLAASLPVG